jgi:hypothetical protein
VTSTQQASPHVVICFSVNDTIPALEFSLPPSSTDLSNYGVRTLVSRQGGTMAPNMALQCDGEGHAEEFLLVHGYKPPSQPEMPSVFRIPKLKGHDLFEVTVDEIQHLYSSEAFTAEEYVQFCLDQIQVTNPYLEAVIETNPDALKIARQMDHERKNGRVRGPLHGIPVLVKDVGAECSISFFPYFHQSPFICAWD